MRVLEMRRTADDRPTTWRTRAATLLSLAVGAGLVVAALVGPGLLAVGAPDLTPARAGTGPAGLETASAQAALVTQEDERLLAQVRGVPWNTGPYTDLTHDAPALVLTPGHGPYDLDALLVLGAATRVDAATVELTTSVLVAPGAELVLAAPDTTLRLASGSAGFTSIVGWEGSVTLAGEPGRPLTVQSWDPAAAAPDRAVADGRSYVRVVGGALRTSDVALSDLGFWSGRTGGVALTGSNGTAATGSITTTRVRGGHYGLYSADSENLLVDGSSFDDSAVDGILLHRGSTGAVVANSSLRANGGNGLTADRGAADLTVRAVVTEANAADGIRIDGRPLAERPGPAGMALDGHAGFGVVDSTSRSNGGSGILVWDADDVLVRGNDVTGNRQGIVVRGASRGVTVDTNTVTRTAGAAIAVRGGPTLTDVVSNAISSAQTGVQVRDSVVRVRANTVDDVRRHALSFQGAATGSTAERNVLAGRGASSIDLRRTDPGVTVAVIGNTDEGWQVTRTRGQWLDDLFGNPLLGLWALVLLVPVVVGAIVRRRTPPAGPYPASAARPVLGPPPTGVPPARVRSAESDTRVTVVGVR